jgi:hypothetical protein
MNIAICVWLVRRTPVNHMVRAIYHANYPTPGLRKLVQLRIKVFLDIRNPI